VANTTTIIARPALKHAANAPLSAGRWRLNTWASLYYLCNSCWPSSPGCSLIRDTCHRYHGTLHVYDVGWQYENDGSG
jgi:hypothetical protein